MKLSHSKLPAGATILAATLLAGAGEASVQPPAAVPRSVSTPEKVQTRIGTLEFPNGTPSQATLEKVYGHPDGRARPI